MQSPQYRPGPTHEHAQFRFISICAIFIHFVVFVVSGVWNVFNGLGGLFGMVACSISLCWCPTVHGMRVTKYLQMLAAVMALAGVAHSAVWMADMARLVWPCYELNTCYFVDGTMDGSMHIPFECYPNAGSCEDALGANDGDAGCTQPPLVGGAWWGVPEEAVNVDENKRVARPATDAYPVEAYASHAVCTDAFHEAAAAVRESSEFVGGLAILVSVTGGVMSLCVVYLAARAERAYPTMTNTLPMVTVGHQPAFGSSATAAFGGGVALQPVHSVGAQVPMREMPPLETGAYGNSPANGVYYDNMGPISGGPQVAKR